MNIFSRKPSIVAEMNLIRLAFLSDQTTRWSSLGLQNNVEPSWARQSTNVLQTVHDVTVERSLFKTSSQAELRLVEDSGYCEII